MIKVELFISSRTSPTATLLQGFAPACVYLEVLLIRGAQNYKLVFFCFLSRSILQNLYGDVPAYAALI